MDAYIPEFSDESFFRSTALENKIILQYTIDVMKELSTQKDNLVVSHDGHELYLFEVNDWFIMFHQHNNNGKVYFDKKTYYDKLPFRYEIAKLKNAQQNNLPVEDFYSSYAMCFGSVNYDVNKTYISKRELEMQIFSAKHVNKDKKEVARLEKTYEEVDNYSYETVPPQWLIESIDSFKQLKITIQPPSLKQIEQVGLDYAKIFEPDYQKLVLDSLNKTKRLCKLHNFNETTESFSYSDYSVYYHTEQKALVFTDQNGGFVAFEHDKNSWLVTYFSDMYGKVEDETYFFNKKPELKDITLEIKDGQFVNAGANMYSFHYNVLLIPEAIKEELGASKKKMKM